MARIDIRMTDEQYAALTNNAAKAGMGPGSYAEKLVLDKARPAAKKAKRAKPKK